MQAKKSAPNKAVANLKETSPGPGVTANVNMAPNRAIKAKIKIQPNMISLSSRTSLESVFSIVKAREVPNVFGTGLLSETEKPDALKVMAMVVLGDQTRAKHRISRSHGELYYIRWRSTRANILTCKTVLRQPSDAPGLGSHSPPF